MSAYDEGYDAYFDDLTIDDNPYDQDYEEYDDWQNGFDRATIESEDEYFI